MNIIEKRVALSLLAMEQQQADKLHQDEYGKRAYAAFQIARGGLWILASVLKDETELAEAILTLTETLNEAFCQ